MSDIKIIQDKILSILKEFINICEENNLTYYALGGTLLGAVRHKGFIPWDDDIDIGMPREDYEKFKKIASNVLPENYKFLSEDTLNYKKAFSVIRDDSTKIIMNYSKEELVESLWIDIFPLDGMPSNALKKKIHSLRYLYARMMVQLSQFNSLVNQKKENRPFIEKIIIAFANAVNIEKIISVVVPKKRKYYIETLYSHYAHTHDANHLDVTRQIISELRPDYIEAFDQVMKQRSGYMFNMFIMSKENVAAYCEWLFPIIDELYRRLDVTDYSAFDARLFGRISERLFNVWLAKQDLRVKEIPFIYMEKIDLIQKGKSFLQAKFFGRKYGQSF